ncbi:MAG: cytochrome c peroxidase, partial [Planctomycetota bacterium]
AGSPEENEVAVAAYDRIDRVWPILAKRVRTIPAYGARLVDAFDDLDHPSDATIVHVAEALAAFIDAEWRSYDSRYDLWLAGEARLSSAEHRGRRLFFGKAGCATCHPGPLLTDFDFHNTGLPTAGEFALSNQVDLGRGNFKDLTQDPPVVVDDPTKYATFRTPQLRMLAVTGPYMHNGAFESLEDVVEFYDQGGGPDLSGTGTKSASIQPLGLTESEKSALVAFLETGLMGTEIR